MRPLGDSGIARIAAQVAFHDQRPAEHAANVSNVFREVPHHLLEGGDDKRRRWHVGQLKLRAILQAAELFESPRKTHGPAIGALKPYGLHIVDRHGYRLPAEASLGITDHEGAASIAIHFLNDILGRALQITAFEEATRDSEEVYRAATPEDTKQQESGSTSL